jgi:hypothetical protein
MAFREKTAWISLAVDLAVYGLYFAALLRALQAGEVDGGRFIGLFVGCVIVLVLAHIVLSLVAAILAPMEAEAPADERERVIAWKSESTGLVALNALALTVAAAGPLAAGVSPALRGMSAAEIATFLMSNGILFAVVVADLVRAGAQITHYRLGR